MVLLAMVSGFDLYGDVSLSYALLNCHTPLTPPEMKVWGLLVGAVAAAQGQGTVLGSRQAPGHGVLLAVVTGFTYILIEPGTFGV